MSQTSTIEWTDGTWNPVKGCTEFSPGCARCYAKRFAERFRGVPSHPYEFGFDLRLVSEKLTEPLTWTRPQKVFVNSMSDLFHEAVPTGFIARVVEVMRLANWHTYQILTKRSERLAELLSGKFADAARQPQLLWGVSVENRRHGLPRIAHLQQIPGITRFLSIEPLLEDLGPLNLEGIHWVIVGGESGHRPHPMEADWVRSIRNQCVAGGVPFFFTQWGGTNKKKAGRELDGRTHDEYPTVTTAAIPDRVVRKQMIQNYQEAASTEFKG